jgi:hypothetical protein
LFFSYTIESLRWRAPYFHLVSQDFNKTVIPEIHNPACTLGYITKFFYRVLLALVDGFKDVRYTATGATAAARLMHFYR